MPDLTPIFLSIKLAFIVTVLLFFISIPVTYFFENHKGFLTTFFKVISSMPLILPPTVLGFYLLVFFQKDGFIAKFFDSIFDIQLIFTFEGLVLASIIYSFPFMVNPISSALENLPKSLSEASFSLGKSRITTFLRVLLPNVKPSIIIAWVMTFAHTLGEFGVILMLGGSISGETKVASIAIYEEVELMNNSAAHIYSGILLFIAFLIMFFVQSFNQKKTRLLG